VRLICFPHAGGSASFYLPVSAALTSRAEVLAVQYPGRQDRLREPAIDSVSALADQVHAAVRELPERRSVFFGHSMGAVVAFEVARRLEAAGEPTPERLVLSGRRAPSTTRDERVHRSGDSGLVRRLIELDGTDGSLLDDPEVLAMILPALRADYRAIETYRPVAHVSVGIPVSVFTGDADPMTTAAEAAAWRAHGTAGVEVVTFPGGHFYLTERPAAVLAALAERLG
jgi:surfactin synthase thioesterase subunit